MGIYDESNGKDGRGDSILVVGLVLAVSKGGTQQEEKGLQTPNDTVQSQLVVLVCVVKLTYWPTCKQMGTMFFFAFIGLFTYVCVHTTNDGTTPQKVKRRGKPFLSQLRAYVGQLIFGETDLIAFIYSTCDRCSKTKTIKVIVTNEY